MFANFFSRSPKGILVRSFSCLMAISFAAIFCSRASVAFAETISSTSATRDFNITINYSNTLSSALQTAVNDATAYWESTVLAYNSSNTSLNGLTITFGTSSSLGATTIGQSGITSYTYADGKVYSKTSEITLSSSYASTRTTKYMYYVILHEMAHSIGFSGSFWNYNGNYVYKTGAYTGANALAAYQTEFKGQASVTSVPVDTTSGVGTAYSHWAESSILNQSGVSMYYELMTGYMESDTTKMFVSNTTIQSFADNGYVVIPEPGTVVLLFVASAIGLIWRYRRKRASSLASAA